MVELTILLHIRTKKPFLSMEFEVIRLRNELSKLKREDALQEMILSELRDRLSDTTSRITDLKAELPKSKLQLEGLTLPAPEDDLPSDPRSSVDPRTPGSGRRALHLRNMFLGTARSDEPETAYRYVPPTNWEYVLVLLNPDHPTVEPKGINERDAIKLFQKCFRGEEAGSFQQTLRNFSQELKAFQAAFHTLDNFEDMKKWARGGRLVPDSVFGFRDTMAPPKDFLTLIRNILMVKLTQHLGLTSRQVLSSDGLFIYIVLYGSEADYQNEALRSQALTQLSISMIDLNSLEPCDLNLRPLRVLRTPEYVRRALNDLKLEARDVFQGEHFEQFGNYGETYEPAGVTEAQWEAYYNYLLKLRVAISKLKTVELPTTYRHLFLGKTIRKMKDKCNRETGLTSRLLDLWDRLGISRPIGPYTPYTQNINRRTGEDSFAALWRTYRVDEVGHRSYFKRMNRLKLLYSLINRQVVLHKLTKSALIFDNFALHDDWELNGTQRLTALEDYDYLMVISKFNSIYTDAFQSAGRKGLKQAWEESFLKVDLPLDKIRNYFGEKIGLFFAFKSLMAKFLMVPSVVGLGVFLLHYLGTEQTQYMIAVDSFYCYFLGIWASLTLEYWIRKESMCTVLWGMVDYEEEEETRPQFQGELRRSAITDQMDEPYFNPVNRRFIVAAGLTVSLAVIVVVIGIVAVLMTLRKTFINTIKIRDIDIIGPIISIANGVQIQIFNILYSTMALKLTDLENHQTQSEYEDSFILKNYCFQFVNSFNSLFYTAFAKTYVEGCSFTADNGDTEIEIGASCLGELRTQLTVLFLVAYLRDVLLILLPYWNFKRQLRRLKVVNAVQMKAERWKLAGLHDTRVIRDEIEEQYILSKYTVMGMDGTYKDYMSIAVMFGYVTMFGLGFPLSSLLMCLLLLLEIRVNKLKMLNLTRRPQPMGVRHIGIWWGILQFTAVAAIFTNAGLFCFTESTFENIVPNQTLKFIPFGIMSISLLIIRTWVRNAIPDIPTTYETLQKRHDHIVNSFIRSRTQAQAKVARQTVALNFKVYCPDHLHTD